MADTETSATIPLGQRIKAAGPVANPAAAERLLETLIEAADADGWRETLDAAWPALAPVAGASPYLAGLMRRRPAHLRRILERDPTSGLIRILAETDALDAEPDDVRAPLRVLKADLHLLTALADLGGVWDLDQVTGALSSFADAACRAALRAVAAEQRARGRLVSPPDDSRGPIPGLFGLAMGKHGANELNYSSDIDISLFFEPRLLGLALREGEEMQDFANRVGKGIATLLTERTADGYVFRVDLRLRPDPSSTPPVVSGPMALAYYESVGQNWERAAFIKARPVLGDPRAAARFVKALRPFIW
ncbi:MAG: glutamine-synthetase adenylyltransferase, partial [Alphaproteobacteria bacterium]|nr:glutamine-synthetase adenylyltransferase [Alphaproteobacteria bacterium]